MTTSRRTFLTSAAALTAIGLLAPQRASARPRNQATQPDIQSRSDWGGDLAPKGALANEARGDVRFLLVHHSETPNGYGPEKVAPRLRNIFEYHTGTKGWPDIAYNFFVDAQGRIWEGRTGSLTAPVRGDATGGSQGHAMLCCFLGDHTATPPTGAAITAMARLTAWLAGTYGIDLGAGPTISFTSRGSNRWPAGTTVVTDPIAGHRDMSASACPGDAAYPLIRGTILDQARGFAGIGATTTTTAALATTAPATATSVPGATSAPAAATSTSPATTTPTTTTALPPGSRPQVDDEGDPTLALGAAAGAIGLLGAGAWILRRRGRAVSTGIQTRADESQLDAHEDETRTEPADG